VQDTVTAIPVNDAALVRDTLAAGEYACVILEPSGAGGGTVPTDVEWVRELRAICTEMDVPLIFDEVITGFRYSPGGYQQEFGITPDLTTMAKILAGGFPGGAVAGRREFVELIEMRDESGWNRGKRISHPGTFNANPLSATAGVACLDHIADGKAHAAANRMGDRLRSGMQKVIDARGLGAEIYGSHSFMHITFTGVRDRSGMGSLGAPLQTAMMLHGVHMGGGGGMTSAVMTEEDIDLTIDAFEQSLGMLGEEGLLVD
jgi:glutamate-1-semialdehyde 2,1-aminomutase